MIRLLLIEDNPMDQELVRRGFRDSRAIGEPVDVTIVESVDAALELLERESFTVILSDYSLPRRTGLDFLQTFRALGHTTPVIMLTGSADTMVAVAALQDGAADFVIKDIAFERALGVVVRRTIDKHQMGDREEPASVSGHDRTDRTQLARQLDAQNRELRRAVQESEALRLVAQTLASEREIATALTLVSRTTAQILLSHAAAVLLKRGHEHVLVSSWGPLKLPTGVKRADLLELLAGDCQWVATATMREDGEPIGVLWVGRSCYGAFQPAETELLQALSDLTSLSIARLRAREQVRRLRDAAPSVSSVEMAAPPDATLTASATDERDATPLTPARDDEPPDDTDHPVALVVDDSEKILLQARLALQHTMTVLTATSGKQALKKYVMTRPKVVVVDLIMPEMDGFATLAELQRLGTTPCIALALRGDTATHERARKAGFSGVVEKPFREGELAAQVTAVLAATERGGDDHFAEDGGYPVLVLPNPAANLSRLLPHFGRHIRALAEDGCDALILDAGQFTDITPEHVTMLARLYAETNTVGMRTAIATPDARVVQKLRNIVDIRNAQYVASRDEAKRLFA